VHGRAADLRQGQAGFFRQHVPELLEPCLAACRQRKEERAPDEHEIGAHGVGFDDVFSGPDAGVVEQRVLVAHRLADLAEREYRRRCAVQLTAAVAGDLDRIDTGRLQADRVIDAQDAFDHQVPVPPVAKAVQLLPVRCRPAFGPIEMVIRPGEVRQLRAALKQCGERPSGVQGEVNELPETDLEGHLETVPQLARPAADFGHIEGQNQRAVSAGLGAVDEALRGAAIPADIELKPGMSFRCLVHGLQ